MKIKMSAVVFALTVMVQAPAYAEEMGASPEPVKKTAEGGHFGAFGGVSNDAYIVGFMTLDPGIILALGVDFTYNGNGVAPPSDDKVQFGVRLHGEYLMYNISPIAIGPELTYVAGIAPGDVLSTNIFLPGLVFWYTPWAAPVAIGAAWDVQFTFQKGADPVISTVTPGLRFAWFLK